MEKKTQPLFQLYTLKVKVAARWWNNEDTYTKLILEEAETVVITFEPISCLAS